MEEDMKKEIYHFLESALAPVLDKMGVEGLKKLDWFNLNLTTEDVDEETTESSK